MIVRAYRYPLNGSDVAPGLPLLDVSGLALRFGGITALDGAQVEEPA